MKALLTLLPLAALAAAPAVLASPYAVRPLPAGLEGGAIAPVAAAFLGNGRLQWYDGGNTISRFPEAGQITLPAMTLPVTPSATPVPMTAAVCDVDRDGDPDIIRACSWNGNAFKYTIQAFLNNGAGVFTAGSRVDWNNSLPYDEGGHHLRIVPADFDKNGSVDLAILETYTNANWGANPDHWDGELYIRWNGGNGAFDTVSNLQPDGIPAFSAISAADYDRDGDMDIYCNDYTTYGPDVIIGFPANNFNQEGG
ncbi:MAG: VCBS repeat-containing protein, partial [Verrucomicrobiaceae bacterium]